MLYGCQAGFNRVSERQSTTTTAPRGRVPSAEIYRPQLLFGRRELLTRRPPESTGAGDLRFSSWVVKRLDQALSPGVVHVPVEVDDAEPPRLNTSSPGRDGPPSSVNGQDANRRLQLRDPLLELEEHCVGSPKVAEERAAKCPLRRMCEKRPNRSSSDRRIFSRAVERSV